MTELPEFLSGGESARLIPVAPSSQRERQACSVLLAVLSVVHPFAQHVFSRMGYRIGRRSWVEAYTEVVFKKQNPDDPDDRPDGLLVLSASQSRWCALVEAKIGNARIKPEQIARYQRIARANDLDAIITISNELTSRPDHLPYDLPREGAAGIRVYHWPWPTLSMIASMLVREASRFDEEQAFILQEALRFFDHQNSDIRGFAAMAPSWPALVQRLRAGAEIKPGDADVADTLRSWHQAQAHFCVALTRELGMPFTLKLSRQHREEQRLRWTEDLATFVESKQLFLDFEV